MKLRTLLALGLLRFSAINAVAVAQEEPATGAQNLWRPWLDEDAVYIISDGERAAFNRLTTVEIERSSSTIFGILATHCQSRQSLQGRALSVYRVCR